MLNPSEISDSDLVNYCLKNKRQYQELLYRRYADQMFTLACTYTKDDDEACDVLQEGFVKVFRKLNTYKHENPLGAWIRRIIINTALEHYRKKQRGKEVIADYVKDVDYTIENIISSLNADEIIYAVNQLPSKAGMVLKLYSIEGYSHKEIADNLQISEGTSKSQLNRARSLLKAFIDKRNG